MANCIPTILLLCLLAAAAYAVSARPCKTLFFITTTYFPRNPNPDPLLQDPRYLSLIFTTTTVRFPRIQPSLSFRSNSFEEEARSSSMASSEDPVRFYSSVSSSIRDRSKDIMGIVGALLVGVGFGVLTGVAIFFVWALFSPRHFDFSDGSDSEDHDIGDAKKFGYVKIPAEIKVIEGVDDVKKAGPPA
ncbi:hypothetical protein F511_04661 [Dorcoceras hygrometricum]|uniref:Uncharacterized protein n=1 Tax=Dorcoceras hygrometricum TaxID=472368 RepID=A0A2Z7B0U6_9LAMI|nr:hypothetical protein F511_04661 [Dorcoceras hygrometricum]